MNKKPSKKLAKKLDKRNTGYGEWKYYINRRIGLPTINGMYKTITEANQEFYAWRDWCWQSWGPSKELSDWLNDNRSAGILQIVSQNQNWCWQNDQYVTRIYLRGDEEMTAFVLKWGV